MKTNQNGSVNVFLILFIVTLLLFFGSVGFGVWAYGSRQDYKSNTDEKIAAAVEVAKQEVSSEKDNEFIQKEKQPLKTYNGPAAYGSIKIKYPKTWAAYVEEGGGTAALSGYFHPNVVPGTKSGASYALRTEVINKTFGSQVKTFTSKVNNGKVQIKSYKIKNVPGSVALRIDGEIAAKKQGTMIMIQSRDKTIKIWTEADQFRDDLFNHVLSNLEFTL